MDCRGDAKLGTFESVGKLECCRGFFEPTVILFPELEFFEFKVLLLVNTELITEHGENFQI